MQLPLLPCLKAWLRGSLKRLKSLLVESVFATGSFAPRNSRIQLIAEIIPIDVTSARASCTGELESMLAELRADVIASGANLDDMGDYRPGLKAASEHGVRHPLQECGFTKADVRALALAWGLPTWDKPATPCLSSRIAYGEEATPERNRMIDQAEQWLRSRGFHILRVRYHKGDLARIEVPLDDLPRFVDLELRGELLPAFRTLGFKFVTLDLEGFRSGSLNSVIPVEDLLRGILVEQRYRVHIANG